MLLFQSGHHDLRTSFSVVIITHAPTNTLIQVENI